MTSINEPTNYPDKPGNVVDTEALGPALVVRRSLDSKGVLIVEYRAADEVV